MTYLTPLRVQASRILRVEKLSQDTGIVTTDDPEDPTFRYSRTWGLDNAPPRATGWCGASNFATPPSS